MATAADLRNEMTTYMDQNGIKYRVVDEGDNIVRLSFAARESLPGGGASTQILVDFDEKDNEADAVHFVCYKFAQCSLDRMAEVLLKLNGYNTKYRWVKFYVRPEETTAYLYADTDARLVPGAAAKECVTTCFLMSDIVEEAIVDLGDLVQTGDEEDETRRKAFALLQQLFGK